MWEQDLTYINLLIVINTSHAIGLHLFNLEFQLKKGLNFILFFLRTEN